MIGSPNQGGAVGGGAGELNLKAATGESYTKRETVRLFGAHQCVTSQFICLDFFLLVIGLQNCTGDL